MTLQVNTAEGQTSGTAVSTSGTNTGGGSGDAFSAANSGITFSNAQAAHGTRSYLMPGTAATFNTLTFTSPDATTNGFSVRFYLYATTAPSAEIQFINVQTSAGAAVAALNLMPTMVLRMKNAADASVYTFTNAVPLNQWVRVSFYGTINATTGSMTCSFYSLDSLTAIDTHTVTGANTGSTAPNKVLYGKLTQAPSMTTYYFDDIAQNLDSSTEIPPVSNTPPTVDAGANQTVTAGAGVSLSATASDADGTIASHAWTFDYPTSGAPTLTGASTATPTFTAGGAGSLYVLRDTVTDNGGATATDTMEVRVASSGLIDPLPGYTPVTTGTWTNTGGAANIGAALSDSSDATYVESGSLSGTEQEIRVRLDPATVRASLSVTFRVAQDAAGTIAAKGRLYEGTTLRQEWTLTTTTSPADQVCALSAGTVSAISDWGNLWAAVAGTG